MPIAEDPEVPGQPDPFDGLVLDQNFVRGAAIKEPSARTRILSARWKQEPPVDPGGRRWSPESDPRPRGRTRRWRTPLVVLAVLLVAALAVGFDGHFSPSSFSGASSLGTPDVVTTDHPWAGSPAIDWADGADGIVLPAAHAVGTYNTTQVADSLQRVKAFLVAANLDPEVIAGGYPAKAIALVDPLEGQPEGPLLQTIERSLKHPTDTEDPLALFSRFDPRQAVMVGPVVKVKGTMTVADDGHNGLRVLTDYTFVYALRPGPSAGDASLPPVPPTAANVAAVSQNHAAGRLIGASTIPGNAVKRTIVRRAIMFDVPDPARFIITPSTLTIRQYPSSVGDTECGPTTGFFRPVFPGGPVHGPAPDGETVDPYDRASAVPTQGEPSCGGDSRN